MNRDEPSTLTRREAIRALAASATALAGGCAGTVPAPSTAPIDSEVIMSELPALSGNHAVVPLPFDPRALHGLSERLLTSHHANNYGGAVRNLNRVEQELAQIGPATPPFVVATLRERELTFRNSKSLHEAYFANLGGDGRLAGAVESAIATAYGSSAAWEAQFRSTAMGLGGGSGWVILALELDTGALRTIGSGNHTQVLASAVPLLVLDMYEHSYHIDFGAEHARYIDAFFANVNWEEVDRRLDAGRRAFAVLSRGAA